MRYFAASPMIEAAIRENVRELLQQPNGRAEVPWPVGGDFTGSDGLCYVALGPHHTEGPFWEPVLIQAVASGVIEVTAEQYAAQSPPSPI